MKAAEIQVGRAHAEAGADAAAVAYDRNTSFRGPLAPEVQWDD